MKDMNAETMFFPPPAQIPVRGNLIQKRCSQYCCPRPVKDNVMPEIFASKELSCDEILLIPPLQEAFSNEGAPPIHTVSKSF